MATNNSMNNNTTLDNALDALLNDTEFCRQFDIQRQQPMPTNTTTDERASSSIEATPDPLDVAFLDESTLNERHKHSPIHLPQSPGQIIREEEAAAASLRHILETITEPHNELPSSSPLETMKIVQSKMTPTKRSIGTMPMTPVGFKSVGTMPMTPVGFKSVGTMSETPTTMTSSSSSSSSSPRITTDTIDLCSPDLPTDASQKN